MTEMENVIIIGSGPAGHTASIYLARANLSPLMLEGRDSGGLLTTTKTVENFPGFPEGVDGFELTERFKEQSLRFGTRIVSENVEEIVPKQDFFEVKTEKKTYKTKRVLIATGSTPKHLDAKNYEKFWQKGISTCAVCDGGLPRYRNQPVSVVGGGDSACEEAIHLSHTASTVYLIHRRDKLRASKIMVDRLFKVKNIVPIWNSSITEITGNGYVEKIVLDRHEELNVKGLFVAIGHTPNTGFVKNLVKLDDAGYIVTNDRMETSLKGVYAAGDVRDPIYRQAITAAGSGCMASLEIERSLGE